MSGLSSVAMQVMWNRLISVVEEQARALVRTAFSTSVREALRTLRPIVLRPNRILLKLLFPISEMFAQQFRLECHVIPSLS